MRRICLKKGCFLASLESSSPSWRDRPLSFALWKCLPGAAGPGEGCLHPVPAATYTGPLIYICFAFAFRPVLHKQQALGIPMLNRVSPKWEKGSFEAKRIVSPFGGWSALGSSRGQPLTIDPRTQRSPSLPTWSPSNPPLLAERIPQLEVTTWWLGTSILTSLSGSVLIREKGEEEGKCSASKVR